MTSYRIAIVFVQRACLVATVVDFFPFACICMNGYKAIVFVFK